MTCSVPGSMTDSIDIRARLRRRANGQHGLVGEVHKPLRHAADRDSAQRRVATGSDHDQVRALSGERNGTLRSLGSVESQHDLS
jgi:hypothetical protein